MLIIALIHFKHYTKPRKMHHNVYQGMISLLFFVWVLVRSASSYTRKKLQKNKTNSVQHQVNLFPNPYKYRRICLFNTPNGVQRVLFLGPFAIFIHRFHFYLLITFCFATTEYPWLTTIYSKRVLSHQRLHQVLMYPRNSNSLFFIFVGANESLDSAVIICCRCLRFFAMKHLSYRPMFEYKEKRKRKRQNSYSTASLIKRSVHSISIAYVWNTDILRWIKTIWGKDFAYDDYVNVVIVQKWLGRMK